MAGRYPRPGTGSKLRVSLGLALLVGLACDPPPPPPRPAAPATPTTPRAPRPSDPDEVARLNDKRAGLEALLVEMKGVVDELSRQRARADALEARLDELKRGLDEAQVKAALDAAAKAAEAPGGPREPLRRQAQHIDAEMKRWMGPEKIAAEDGDTVAGLKRQIGQLRTSVNQLAPATRAAFQALSLVAQIELALPALEQLR